MRGVTNAMAFSFQSVMTSADTGPMVALPMTRQSASTLLRDIAFLRKVWARQMPRGNLSPAGRTG